MRRAPARRTAAEREARAVVASRSHGWCELGCGRRATDASHRLARSHGGPWSADNIIHLCRADHAGLHANPRAAVAAGLHLRSHQDPAAEPVWMAVAGGCDLLTESRWVVLAQDGTWSPAEDRPRPDMPWQVRRGA